jgi:hypothetical protein
VNLDSFSLGSDVNSPSNEWNPMISDDWPAFGSQLYFQSTRPGSRSLDLWQATWVPEPSGFVLAVVGLLSAIGYGGRRGNKHGDDCCLFVSRSPAADQRSSPNFPFAHMYTITDDGENE